VAQNAYCNECGTRVPLTDVGTCIYGHPRSALRDVREGEAPSAAGASNAPSVAEVGTPNPTRSEETVSAVMGKAIVIVPSVLVIVIGVWTGYAAGIAFGQSKGEAFMWSVASMLLTAGIVAVLVWDRRRKMNR
jgi:hypothetical protein